MGQGIDGSIITYILSPLHAGVHTCVVIIVGHYSGHIARAIMILLPSLSQSPGNNNIIALLFTKRVEYTILFWLPKFLHGL